MVSAFSRVIVLLNQHSMSSTTYSRLSKMFSDLGYPARPNEHEEPRTSEENGHAQLQSQVELCIVLELCHQR